jgi:hypothetical protein
MGPKHNPWDFSTIQLDALTIIRRNEGRNSRVDLKGKTDSQSGHSPRGAMLVFNAFSECMLFIQNAKPENVSTENTYTYIIYKTSME